MDPLARDHANFAPTSPCLARAYLDAPVAKERVRWARNAGAGMAKGEHASGYRSDRDRRILVIVLIVMAIIYFVRRS